MAIIYVAMARATKVIMNGVCEAEESSLGSKEMHFKERLDELAKADKNPTTRDEAPLQSPLEDKTR